VTAEVQSDLRSFLAPGSVLDGTPAAYLADETETRGVNGRADAVVLPEKVEEVAKVVAWCYERGVAIVPRGGGTGFAAGAVPLDGGVVVSLERLTRVRSFDPLLWRIWVEAGLRTAELRRIVRQSGLFFPPDPGAAEQSQIGGNIATNAGGPHAFKYGVTGAWVTGLEAVLPPGEIVSLGGAIRKDVAGYDLKSLLIGSEGTLGIVTAAWLRLLPAPEVSYPVAAFYSSAEEGCTAIEAVLGNGLVVAALEYLDRSTLRAAGPAFPAPVPSDAGFLVVAEADGSEAEAAGMRAVLLDVLGGQALAVHAPEGTAAIEALWRWRDGVSIAVSAQLGGKVSEDIVVPLDRLSEAIDQTLAIGGRHGLSACSWGHAGDGNLHATFLVSPGSVEELERARAAAEELFVLAVSLGGSVSGEHGVGVVKRGRQGWSPKTAALMTAVKDAFDPRGLMNPGKKI
jgi:glycolate dehydrogenase FAD-linked subunit